MSELWLMLGLVSGLVSALSYTVYRAHRRIDLLVQALDQQIILNEAIQKALEIQQSGLNGHQEVLERMTGVRS